MAAAAALGVVAAQVVRGAHFPSDVLAGALIGYAAEAVENRLALGRDRVTACAGPVVEVAGAERRANPTG